MIDLETFSEDVTSIINTVSNVEGLKNSTVVEVLREFQKYILENAKQGDVGPQGPQGPQGAPGEGIGVDKIEALEMIGSGTVNDAPEGAGYVFPLSCNFHISDSSTCVTSPVEILLKLKPGNNINIKPDGEFLLISAEVTSLESQIEANRQAIQSLQDNMGTLSNDIMNANSNISQLQSDVGTLQSDISSLDARVTALGG